MAQAVISRQGCLDKAKRCCLLAEEALATEERDRWLRLAEYWVSQSAAAEVAPRHRQQRRHERKAVRRKAWIKLPNGEFIACYIADISEGGARLVFTDYLPPKRFKLLVTPQSLSSRFCEIRWQTIEGVGVQFVTADTEETLDEV